MFAAPLWSLDLLVPVPACRISLRMQCSHTPPEKKDFASVLPHHQHASKPYRYMVAPTVSFVTEKTPGGDGSGAVVTSTKSRVCQDALQLFPNDGEYSSPKF